MNFHRTSQQNTSIHKLYTCTQPPNTSPLFTGYELPPSLLTQNHYSQVMYFQPPSLHSTTIHRLHTSTQPPNTVTLFTGYLHQLSLPETMPLFTEYLFPPSLSRQYRGSQVFYFLSASQRNTTAHTLCTYIKLPRRYHCLQVIYFHSAFIVNSTVHKFCNTIHPIQITPLFTGCATNPDLITLIHFTSSLIH